MTDTQVYVVFAICVITAQMWIKACRTLMGRHGRWHTTYGARGRDAAAIEVVAWVFAGAGMGLLVGLEGRSAMAAGLTFVTAAWVLNLWAIACVYLAGERGDRSQWLDAVLAGSFVMCVLVAAAARWGYSRYEDEMRGRGYHYCEHTGEWELRGPEITLWD